MIEATTRATESAAPRRGTDRVKRGLADMLKGGVIMDVVTADQARIAEEAGAVAVMALERVPADIRADGGVARMSDPAVVEAIMQAVSIPVMAKARIGHFVEAQVLQSLGVDYVDESEVLTPADEAHHIDKHAFTVPFVCGATNLGEALRRIAEGAAMIRSKGEAGTGDVKEAVRHMRAITTGIRALAAMSPDERYRAAKDLQASYELVDEVARTGRLPVVLFTAGGIATPADAALMMQLGADGVFVGSGIFKSGDPAKRARAIVEATTYAHDPEIIAKVSRDLGQPMVGIANDALAEGQRLAGRGWCREARELPDVTVDRHRQPARLPGQPLIALDDERPPSTLGPVVGVLALQGDVLEHVHMLSLAGARAVAVRHAEQLADLDGVLLPGGESTTIGTMLERYGLLEPLRARLAGGLPALGTCAGAILMGTEALLSDGTLSDQPLLGVMDTTLRRNAFGRQVASFEGTLEIAGVPAPGMRAAFIRAPWFERLGPGVEALAQVDTPLGARVVVAQAGHLLAAAFHPELTGDPRLHALFVEAIRARQS